MSTVGETKKTSKKEVIRNIAFFLALTIFVTSIVSYLTTGATITSSDVILDANTAAESYLAKNTEYVQQNRGDRAKTLLKKVLSGFNEDYNTHYGAMSVAIANQKYEEALEECNACLALIDEGNANYMGMLMKKGCLEALLQKYQDAVATFHSVIRIDETLPQAHLMLAELYLEQGDVIGATSELVSYSGLNPGDSSQLPVISELYYGQGNYQKAIEYGEKALASGVEPDMDLYNAIGLSRLLGGDYEAAVKDIDRAVELGEKEREDGQTLHEHAIAPLGETCYYRGLCKLTLEQYEEAIPDFDRAIELGYKTSLAYYNRGVCRLQTEDYTGSYEDMKIVVENNDEPEITEIAASIIKAIDDAMKEAEKTA